MRRCNVRGGFLIPLFNFSCYGSSCPFGSFSPIVVGMVIVIVLVLVVSPIGTVIFTIKCLVPFLSTLETSGLIFGSIGTFKTFDGIFLFFLRGFFSTTHCCLLYTSPSPRDS